MSIFRWIATSLLFVAVAVQAADENDPLRQALATVLPNTDNMAIADSPIDGLKQVTIDATVIYASEDGRYLVQGKLFDLATRTDLTEEAMSGVRKGLMKNVDGSELISFTPESPIYDVYVFTDIDCGYCRRLHAQIEDYNRLGIAVHYLFFPRAGFGSPSFDKAVSVWCAKDQMEAFTAAKAGDEPESKKCDNPVKAQYDLGQKIGMTGTPAIVLADGSMVRGYMPPDALLQHLQQANITTR
ncbi:MAG: DsbC family protein [Wenzhouxiangellaceae bacterium]